MLLFCYISASYHTCESSIINENIQSINCTGEGIYYNGNQGADITIIFTEPGVHTMNVSILMNNCNTPKILSKTISVQPSRISISGPTQICDQATYTIDNFPQGATVNWTTSNDLTVASGQNTATVNIARTYDLAINNFIRATINIDGYSFVIEKTGIQIGTVNPLIKIYDARGRYELAPPYYTNTAYTIVAYGDTFSTNPFNYQWIVNQPVESGEPPLLFNGKQFSFIADSVGSYNFSLKYNGECGWSLPTSKAVYFYQNYMLLSFYPNPATDLLTVSVGSIVR